jgi:hypothetical protein
MRARQERFDLRRSEVVELVAHIVELELAVEYANVRAEWDVQLPEVQTGTLRQVDVSVTYDVGDREMFRIVEVQDRQRRMDSPFVDQVEGKREALGAARATLVSTAGFSVPALRRIRSQPTRLDAVLLRDARDEEWPRQLGLRKMEFKLAGRTIGVPLTGRIYSDALTAADRFFIAYGAAQEHHVQGLVAWVFRTDGKKLPGNRPFGLYTWLRMRVPNGSWAAVELEMKVESTSPDGTRSTHRLPPMRGGGNTQ